MKGIDSTQSWPAPQAAVRGAGRNRPAPATAGGTEPPPSPTPQELQAVVETVNRRLAEASRELRFHVDESSGRTVISVLHGATGEVLRQIPPREVLQVAARLAGEQSVDSLGMDLRA